ncbi:MAG: iron-sulfur cluster-binding domain-containing protein [Bacteroidetes bacterium]|nr:iron-sulfur cluster-binding domain-containing protein [Bacteroidota bacterium]
MYKTITVTNVKEEVKGVKSFYFDSEDARQIRYQAGQYLTMIYPDREDEIRRSYSITSSPALQEPLALGVQRIENGLFSRYLFDHVKPGDQLQTIGAGGLFTLPEDLNPYKQVFLFAAGSGITPIYGLIKELLYAHPRLRVVLIYSNRSPERTIFQVPLQQLVKEFPAQLHIEFLFSSSKQLSKARLYRDLLKQLVNQYAIAPPEQLLCYLCGPENYMRMCLYGLRQLEVPLQNIRREYFTTIKRVMGIQPPDKDPHQVSIIYGESVYLLQVQYPDNILQTAKAQGISLPYSCEVGRCGNCLARCRQGKVWMSYNEVLTARELEQGYVLTCVGYPVAGDVVLEI